MEQPRMQEPRMQEPKMVERRQSRGGLRGLFTRNKLETPSFSPVLEDNGPASAIPERSMRAVAEAGIKRSLSLRRNRTGPETLPETPATPVRPSSRMKILSSKSSSKPSPKSTKSSNKSSTRAPTRTSTAWDPPPLFQAYPQAIKHAQLSASTLSADTILRISNHKQSNVLRDEIAQGRMGGAGENTTAGRKATKPKPKHRRQISGSLSKADWTQKIFVLVTSGYLLQYSGDGSFDRLPEKMMQLGKDSVAFASDVIPGKHWVLQISQAMDADGTPAADSRSFLSRLAFRGADYRRTATSLLLVFNSPEDMDSWLAVVRREIEALGGKKHVSETGKPKPDDKIMKLEGQPSHRYQITRDPDQTSNPPSPQLPHFGPPPWPKERDDRLPQRMEDSVTTWSSPQLPLFQQSTGDHSVANSVVSQAERQLDNLRDGSNRFSYMSSGQRTMITSEEGTPATSPTRATTPGFDEASSQIEQQVTVDEPRVRPNASAINERRRSMQTIHVPALGAPPVPKHYRHSTYGGAPRNTRSTPVGTPNFSVPNSSSKRWSVQKNLSVDRAQGHINNQRDSLKGIRKITPSDLKDTRSLSPVKDTSPIAGDLDKIGPPLSSTGNASPQATGLHDLEPSHEHVAEGLSPLVTPSKTTGDTTVIQGRTSLIPLQLPRKFVNIHALSEKSDQQENHETTPQTPPTVPNTPGTFKRDLTKSPRESIAHLPSLPTIANTKTKIRRPISMQVSTPSFTRAPPAIRSATINKPTTPPSTLTLFPRHPASNTSCAVSPFNVDGGVFTPVTVLNPSPSQLPSSPGVQKSRSPGFNINSRTPSLGLGSATPKLRSPPVAVAVRQYSNSNSSGSSGVRSYMPTSTVLSPTHPSAQKPRQGGSVDVRAVSMSPRSLANRRSIPMLVNGPPPAPPPECALPPLPPNPSIGRGSANGKGSENPLALKRLRI
jgi:hypothetical protein